MDVKEAVSVAKNWITDVLEDENLSNVGLEEVEFDDRANVWHITMGFSRPWNSLKGGLSALTGDTAIRRAYRVITVKEPNGEVISMKKRDSDVL